MKKFTYLFVIAALGMVSCAPKSYTITGTMESSTDGDTVFLLERSEGRFVPLDTAVIAKGKFRFTGVQDSAMNCYLIYRGEDDLQPVYTDFFLENGDIGVKMVRAAGGSAVSGTPTNDAYQAFRNRLQVVFDKQQALIDKIVSATPEAPGNEKAEEDALEANKAEIDALESELISVIKASVRANSATPLGAFLLNSYNHYMEYDDVEELISLLSAPYRNDPAIVALKTGLEAAKGTAVGQKFVDFEMKNPEGRPVKLSDYAGKGKLVLVDFWASWCGPCRQEMPEMVKTYAKYRDKNFEIVGVSLDGDAESWKQGLEQLGMTWPQMSGLNSGSRGADLYAIRSIPHVVLIDGDGTIISRGLRGEELQAKLAELMQ